LTGQDAVSVPQAQAALSRLRYNRDSAVRHLCGHCARLGSFIERHGPLKLRVARDPDLFAALCRAIVYQQLSGKAAATIHARFSALFESGRPDADRTADFDVARLRAVGLSQGKALSVLDLARKSTDGTLASLRRIGRMSDAEVIDNLCQVRGIGLWTAQMVLIFNLGRPDVMPATDLGVQKGVQAVYGIKGLPDPDTVLRRTRHLAPFRSAASWYFWRAADTRLMT
jgi:3-methyladenine DNA glycosylase/8-oxoguanine DNA glycosylase